MWNTVSRLITVTPTDTQHAFQNIQISLALIVNLNLIKFLLYSDIIIHRLPFYIRGMLFAGKSSLITKNERVHAFVKKKNLNVFKEKTVNIL